MNIKITGGELNNWDYDEIGNEIPKDYLLSFKFHSEEVIACFTVEELKTAQDGEPLDSCYAETDSDLLDSFDSKLEDKDIATEILSYCKKIWKDYSTNVGVYNYLGGKL